MFVMISAMMIGHRLEQVWIEDRLMDGQEELEFQNDSLEEED